MTFAGALKRLVKKALPQPMESRLRLLVAIRRARRLRASRQPGAKARHRLPQPLIVSLTSFGPRFGTLHLTLESLLDQSIIPDTILLWIAEDELELLPPRIRALEGRGLTVKACPDVRSYKKLVYALHEHPNSYIATADDDVFYEPGWLRTMVEAVDPVKRVIVCHRAHRIVLEKGGRIAPYLSWSMDVQDEAARRPSVDLLPVGIGGILYPPNCFSPEVTERKQFERLCPTADDLWFYWMARKAGSTHKKVGGRFPLILWPTFNLANLASDNWAGGNDRQIRKLEDSFGNPLNFRSSPHL